MWLVANGRKEKEIWLVFFKKHTGETRLEYDDAVEETICFGWIVGTAWRLTGSATPGSSHRAATSAAAGRASGHPAR